MPRKGTTSKSRNKYGLRKGESEHSTGGYQYRWTDAQGKRRSIFAYTLQELREMEAGIQQDQHEKIEAEAQQLIVEDIFNMWSELKRGIKDNTLQNYKFLYKQYIAPRLGRQKITSIVKSDVKRFYNSLADEKCLSINTIDSIHNLLHQIFEMAVDDAYLRRNPTDNALKELRQVRALKGEKRHALTIKEQELFLTYLKKSPQYQHWYPIFAFLIGTGLRVGEAIGLRWCDIDLNSGIIDVNHTLVYYKHAVNGCYSNIHTPKTRSGNRKVPMMDFVKEAIQQERMNQFAAGIRCKAIIDGYTDFVFLNRFGNPQHQGTLNKALKRIVRDCNDAILLVGKKNPVLLPYFSCHSLRHTFATRLCEAGVNVKVIQDILGHADVSTTLDIYAEATQDLKESEMASFEQFWRAQHLN